jgi:hypothetical protein
MSYIASVKKFVEGLSFEEIKTNSEKEPYSFKVSEFGDLYMITFTEKSDLTLDIVRAMNGVIFEKETNKLVHYSFQKTYEGVSVSKDSYTETVPENCEIEISTEGTHIKLYHHNGEWKIGTSRSIDGSLSHWNNKKSFKELFVECLDAEKILLSYLDPELCYSFVMQHPENKICNEISVKYCSMLNSVNTKTNEVIRHTKGFLVEKNIDEILKRIDDDSCTENYIVYLQDGKRIKLLNKNFKEKQDIIKNDPNMKRVYLRCMKEGTTEILRKHYPYNKELFNSIEYRFYIVKLEKKSL